MISLVLVVLILTWLALLGLGFVLLGSLRNQAILSWRLDQLALTAPARVNRNGLKLGAKAPGFALPDAAGNTVALEDFAGRKVFLAFTQSGCGPCETILPALEDLQKKGQFQVVVVNKGDLVSTRDWARKMEAPFPILIEESYELSKKYEAFVTPFAFLVDERGVVVSRGLVTNARQIGFVLSAQDGV
jgi:methylamine dehydrogenase accessory protein MauD